MCLFVIVPFEPASADRGDGGVSPLCLCRQELQDCFVGQIVGEDHIFDSPFRPFHGRPEAVRSTSSKRFLLLAPAPLIFRRKQRTDTRKKFRVVQLVGQVLLKLRAADCKLVVLHVFQETFDHPFWRDAFVLKRYCQIKQVTALFALVERAQLRVRGDN